MQGFVEALANVFCEIGNWLIVLAAIANAVIFGFAKRQIIMLEKTFLPIADKMYGLAPNMRWTKEELSMVKKKRDLAFVLYAWYANMTAIFPLLGILGTVAALVTYSNDTMMDNFMVALGTTLLGVLFAIIFKTIDSLLSGPLDNVAEKADKVITESEAALFSENETTVVSENKVEVNNEEKTN